MRGLQRTALPGPARDPGELGAAGVGEAQGGGEGAGDLGQPLADQDDRAGPAQQFGGLPGLVLQATLLGQRAQPLGLGAGAAGSSAPPSLARPRERWSAIAKTLRLPARAALRSRRKTIGDSSSGSKPASSTAGACSSAR